MHSSAPLKRRRDSGECETDSSENVNVSTLSKAADLDARSIIDRLACKANFQLTNSTRQNVKIANSNDDCNSHDVIYFTPQSASNVAQSN